MELKKEELMNITGGSLTAPFINALSKVIGTLYELGKGAGSSIRRLIEQTYCPIN